MPYPLPFSFFSLLLLKGKDSVPTTVHHVVAELDPVQYGNHMRSERAKHYTTDGVHLPDTKDKKESRSEMIKRWVSEGDEKE